jgi:hypothetical protein
MLLLLLLLLLLRLLLRVHYVILIHLIHESVLMTVRCPWQKY